MLVLAHVLTSSWSNNYIYMSFLLMVLSFRESTSQRRAYRYEGGVLSVKYTRAHCLKHQHDVRVRGRGVVMRRIL